jgi:3-hydroxybutyryl-CoA dehydrogenase
VAWKLKYNNFDYTLVQLPTFKRRGTMSAKNVFIVGAGLMGSGIAQACAQSGINVILNDISQEAMKKALKDISWSVSKLLEKGKLAEDKETILKRISTSADFALAADADLALEAVFENLELKKEIFEKLDEACSKGAILATNTSAISISEIAAATKRPEKVVGIHFFSPVPIMGAAELIRGMATSDETFAAGEAFIRHLGKEPILVRRDVPAFVINRINYRANLEAMRLVEEGVATVEDIDKGLRLASGRKMGPFEIGDMVGLDVTYGALMSIYEATKDPYWYPPAIMRYKVKAGHLGRKTGKGWYDYSEERTKSAG